jgi:predicted phosphodiesterase|tara:strand:+ start:53 stop:1042 length:990 start_codon:yes stop_codon:yes gene_type:complete
MGTEKLKGSYLVLSDIQGSFQFLDRFFKATKNMKKNGSLCLGDIVHKFTDFSDNRCIEYVRKNVDYCVRGNHEDKLSKKSKQKITPENFEYISGLPRVVNLGNIVLFHSSLQREGLRLTNERQIQKEGEYIQVHYPEASIALFGHTHRKGCYTLQNKGVNQLEGDNIQLNPEKLTLINPGGIGLWYGLEKNFARIDIDNNQLNFFTLEQAEKMSYKANVVNAFDDRWMPELNLDSYQWFLQYTEKDVPALKKEGKTDELFDLLAKRLTSFDRNHMDSVGVSRKKRYLEDYSLELAKDVNKIRKDVNEIYDVKNPFESREEYLSLERKKY